MCEQKRHRRLDREHAAVLYQAGKTDREIAAETGVALDTVQVWRRSRGWKQNPGERRERISQLSQCARSARAAGMNYGQYMAQQTAAERARRLEASDRASKRRAQRAAAQKGPELGPQN